MKKSRKNLLFFIDFFVFCAKIDLQKNKTRGIETLSLSGAPFGALGDKEIAVKLCSSSHYRKFP